MRELVLVGDEDPFNLRLLEEVCDAAGYRVQTAADGPQVLDMVARERPDLLMLDGELPKLDGFEVLRILKADVELCSIPVLIIASYDDVESRSRAVTLGAEDCVSKPFRVFEVQQRIRNALRAARGDQHAARSSPPPSRAELGMSLEYELTRSERYGHPLTLVRLAWSATQPPLEPHAARAVHAQLAEVVRTCLRAADQLFALADGELAALLPATDAEGAANVAERMRERVLRAAPWEHYGRTRPSLGLGIASTGSRPFRDAHALLEAATPTLDEDSGIVR
jgi:two-component system, cell cycle response regulator